MNREEVLRRVYYSYFLESMQATLYGRIDRLLSFAQLLLGSVVFASLGKVMVWGALVAAISAIAFVWRPARSAMECEQQSGKLKRLISEETGMTDAEFLRAYQKAEETDSAVIGGLRDAALKRAYIVLNRPDESAKIRLTRFGSLLSAMAGDRPRDH